MRRFPPCQKKKGSGSETGGGGGPGWVGGGAGTVWGERCCCAASRERSRVGAPAMGPPPLELLRSKRGGEGWAGVGVCNPIPERAACALLRFISRSRSSQLRVSLEGTPGLDSVPMGFKWWKCARVPGASAPVIPSILALRSRDAPHPGALDAPGKPPRPHWLPLPRGLPSTPRRPGNLNPVLGYQKVG